MQCPTDGSTLVMSERSGIEIDYCPQCRGVWLDRGELDKIIDRSLSQEQGPPSQPRQEPQRGYEGGYQTPGYPQQHHSGYRKPHKRKDSWLSELFD